MSLTGNTRAPVTLDRNLLDGYIYQPSGFPCQRMEDYFTFYDTHNVHAPLHSVTFYTSQSEGPLATDINTTYMMFSVRGFTNYQFRYTITHNSEDFIKHHKWLMPFEDPSGLALTFFGTEPVSNAFHPKFGRPLCEFIFREQLGITFYELQANLINVLPFYRLPVGLSDRVSFDVMAWSIEVAKVLDEFCWLNLEPGLSAEYLLRRAIQRPTIRGEILAYPALSEEYTTRVSAFISGDF